MAAGNMFERIKSMIAECMKKRAADACGDCAMKGVCNHKWTKPEGKAVNGWPRPAASPSDNPLLGLFDAFAKAITQRPAESQLAAPPGRSQARADARKRRDQPRPAGKRARHEPRDAPAPPQGRRHDASKRSSTASASASPGATSAARISRSRRPLICSASPIPPHSRARSSAGPAAAPASCAPNCSLLFGRRLDRQVEPSLQALAIDLEGRRRNPDRRSPTARRGQSPAGARGNAFAHHGDLAPICLAGKVPSEAPVGLVADEPHPGDMRALGHRQHLVDPLVARLRFGLEVELGYRRHRSARRPASRAADRPTRPRHSTASRRRR